MLSIFWVAVFKKYIQIYCILGNFISISDIIVQMSILSIRESSMKNGSTSNRTISGFYFSVYTCLSKKIWACFTNTFRLIMFQQKRWHRRKFIFSSKNILFLQPIHIYIPEWHTFECVRTFVKNRVIAVDEILVSSATLNYAYEYCFFVCVRYAAGAGALCSGFSPSVHDGASGGGGGVVAHPHHCIAIWFHTFDFILYCIIDTRQAVMFTADGRCAALVLLWYVCPPFYVGWPVQRATLIHQMAWKKVGALEFRCQARKSTP